MPVGRQILLQVSDVEAIAKNVSSVSSSRARIPWACGAAALHTQYADRAMVLSVCRAVLTAIEDFAGLRIVAGRSINAFDEQQRRKVALIGRRVKDQLFTADESAVGSDITINGISFTVIGVFQSLQRGNEQQEERTDLFAERHAALCIQSSRLGRQFRGRAQGPGYTRASPKTS